jgi:hypothetical protein
MLKTIITKEEFVDLSEFKHELIKSLNKQVENPKVKKQIQDIILEINKKKSCQI